MVVITRLLKLIPAVVWIIQVAAGPSGKPRRTGFSALRSGRPEATGLGRDRRAFRTNGGGSIFPRRQRLFLEILHDEEVAAADQIPAKWKTTL